MERDKRFHISHYLMLIFILSLGITGFFYFQGDPNRQFMVAVITSFLYFTWGIIHHQQEGDLHPKIVVEYLLIAVLAIFLLKGAIFR